MELINFSKVLPKTQGFTVFSRVEKMLKLKKWTQNLN